MAYLFDTGVLLRAFDATNVECATIRAAWRRLRERGETVSVALQNIAEFWNVSTRPSSQNGYGISPQRARGRVAIIEQNCRLLTEFLQSYAIWSQLAVDLPILGVAAHDARLVSVMIANGIDTVVTLNERDFRRYSNIKSMSPGDVFSA